jgi:fructose-1,6-bisphosphatase I/sedoheptulose-1,7-bisphosphatase
VLDVVPGDVHQRVSFIFGAAEEVARIEDYHGDTYELTSTLPLYGKRGLYRVRG